MIVDFKGGMICLQGRTVFDVVPLYIAVQPGWPAGITMVPTGAIPVTERHRNVYWTEDSWPMTCARCNPAGWVRCQFPAGTSVSPS